MGGPNYQNMARGEPQDPFGDRTMNKVPPTGFAMGRYDDKLRFIILSYPGYFISRIPGGNRGMQQHFFRYSFFYLVIEEA